MRFQTILTVEAALKAVEHNGYALRYVKEQTEQVCLKAVEHNGDALQYVKEQTEQVCLKAVEHNGYALQYVPDYCMFIKIAALCGITVEKE